MSKHKALSKGDASVRNQLKINQVISEIDSVVVNFTEIRPVRFSSSSTSNQPSLLDEPGTITINREAVFSKARAATSLEKARMGLHEEKLAAVANILESYGLLSQLTPTEVEKLISAIGKIFILDIKK
jgi:hypothetical protein